jgi:DNA gyrase/topoisomerase IV subunit A
VVDIRECGRVTQGVRLMRVGEGSRIVDVDVAAPEDEENGEHDDHHEAEAPESGEGRTDDLSWQGRPEAEPQPQEDNDL